MKEVVIKLTKCTLVLTEPEIMSALAAKPDVFQKAIKRGKGLLRAQNVERKQCQVDRWAVFEALNSNPKYLSSDFIHAVESMSVTELREGVCEYLLTMLHKNHRDNKTMIGG